MGIFKSLFGGGSKEPHTDEESAFVYEGFNVQPSPRQGENGWTTEAIITKNIDGELKTHHFIRADTTGNVEGAIELIQSKTRTLIDQVGENLFK